MTTAASLEPGWLPPRILRRAGRRVIPPLPAFQLGNPRYPWALPSFPWAFRWALPFVLLPAAQFLALSAALPEILQQPSEWGERQAVAQARQRRFGPFSEPEAGG